MTGLQEMRDEILRLEIELHRKRMQFCRALGEKNIARHHRFHLKSALTRLREFREGIGNEQMLEATN